MLGMRTRIADVARDSQGFTLPELLIATVLSLVVIGGAVQAFTASMSDQPRLQSQAAGIQQARTTMEQITRELRQGSTVPTPAPRSSAV
jgi:prepilin-type N-terminal cleavage/methylation domain-containing protein